MTLLRIRRRLAYMAKNARTAEARQALSDAIGVIADEADLPPGSPLGKPIGELLQLDMHHIEESETGTFEAGMTACGLEANRPPHGAIEGYSVQRDLALTTAWARVTCDSCLKSHEPIDMLLFCPRCHAQHVDASEDKTEDNEATRWNNPPHRSHLCHSCGTIWRPADIPTNGVARIGTLGKKDTWGR